MTRMRPSLRLALCALMIVGSSLYAVMVAKDPARAQAVALWYIAVLVTIFVLVNVWKRP